MAAPPKSGVLETTSTTGTGAYTLAGASTGYRAFTSADNGLQYHYGVRTQSQSEWGLGTYTHSTRQLSRDTILGNYLDTTSPVNWGAGTKEVACVLAAERVAMTDVENVFRAAQRLNANTLWFDADNDTGIQTISDDYIRLLANGAEFINFDHPNKVVQVVTNDQGSTPNPGFLLRRDSASPANNDSLGYFQFQGRDSAQALLAYAHLYAFIENVTAGAAGGRFNFQVLSGGSLKSIFSLRPSAIVCEASTDFFTGGKTGLATNTVGCELQAIGRGVFAVQDGIPIAVNRKGSDGAVIEVLRDGASQGDIKVNSGVVSITAFVGTHPAEWAPDVIDGSDFETLGSVVCAAEGTLPGDDRLPLVRPATSAADRSVYGVVAGPKTLSSFKSTTPRMLLDVWGVGAAQVRCVGPVAKGDLLETSDVPGAARAQADDIVRSSTLGKASQDSPDEGGVRLVPAVLYAG